MTGERWQEIRNVLEAALRLDSAGQRAYLDQVCGSDQSLRREVESLLAADKQALGMIKHRGPESSAENHQPQREGACYRGGVEVWRYGYRSIRLLKGLYGRLNPSSVLAGQIISH
jgi:hypothetical protein